MRGLGGKNEVVYHDDMSSIIFPWTGIVAKRKAAKLQQRSANPEEGDPKDSMVWTNGKEKPRKGEPGLRPGERYILKDLNGMLLPGQMMLVVGRPGSGCTTMLKALASLTEAYAGTDGAVQYGNMDGSSKEFKPHRNLVCFASEEDVHDPNLTVGRTLDFATRTQLVSPNLRPGSVPADEYRTQARDGYLSTFGISHVVKTKVGDQYVRGVSGELNRSLAPRDSLTVDRWREETSHTCRGIDCRRVNLLLGQCYQGSRRQYRAQLCPNLSRAV